MFLSAVFRVFYKTEMAHDYADLKDFAALLNAVNHNVRCDLTMPKYGFFEFLGFEFFLGRICSF